MAEMTEITITKPDDWHVHFRDGEMLKAVAPWTARQFGRAIIMPNLPDPVTTAAQAADYRRRILQALPDSAIDAGFLPLMTSYLTDQTDPDDLAQGYVDGVFTAAKLYPANATTNSAHGVSDVSKIHPVLEKMQEIGMPLLIHGEVVDHSVDVFDREEVFIKKVLRPLLTMFPALRVVLEHITTKQAVEFVRAMNGRLAATITAHHLIINRTDIFKGGIRPHLYCLPIAKREEHRLALREAATSGEASFFLGTDTAPHPVGDKETDCGCAGIFTGMNAMELYAQVFEEEDALDKLEAFASLNGPAFYGLEPNSGALTLKREDWTVPESLDVGDGRAVRPFMAGEVLHWRVQTT
jgi:dihydroorotase